MQIILEDVFKNVEIKQQTFYSMQVSGKLFLVYLVVYEGQ